MIVCISAQNTIFWRDIELNTGMHSEYLDVYKCNLFSEKILFKGAV
jgi:hypothetical protein